MKRLSFMPFGLVLTVLVAAMLGSCIDERYTENAPSGDEVQLLVELNVAGISTAAVRAHSANTEKQIDKLDVLVFYGATGKFAYKTHGVPESGKYKVNLKKSTTGETYTFVFLANLRSEVTTANSAGKFSPTTSKDDALEAITFEAFPVAAPVPWNNGTTRYLPMWGEIATAYTVDATLHTLTVSMQYSVARVDILLNPASTSTPENLSVNGFSWNFTLDGVKVYNANSIGAAAPQGSIATATTPTVPQPNARKNYEYLNFTVDQQEFGMRRDIYITEAANTTTEGGVTTNIAESAMTCVVVKLTNTVANTSSWYRLDFKNQATGLRWDILRNYCYSFNIMNITGPGYTSAQEAFEAHPVNLEYEMTVSNESDDESAIKEVVFNGQYKLGVSQKEFFFPYEGRTYTSDDNALYIETDYRGGWTMTNENNWLKIVDENGDPITEGLEGITKVKLVFSQYTTPILRTGKIRVSLAAGLSVEITVNQSSILDGHSNCYMLAPNTALAFYLTRPVVNDGTLSSAIFDAYKLWDDAGTDPEGAVKGYEVFNTGALHPYIIVTAGSKSGNALIAVHKDNVSGPIVWSYHIWVTDYDGTATWTNNGNTFMDRNLGATRTTVGGGAGSGLFYQWGRKDPFPELPDAGGTPPSGSGSFSFTDTTSSTNIDDGIKNPNTFYLGNIPPRYDWLSPTNKDDELWGDTGDKTIYDPCPKGWRVPRHTGDYVPDAEYPWGGMTADSGFSNGYNWGTNAVYPAAGMRRADNGKLRRVGSHGYYWTGSQFGNEGNTTYDAKCLYFDYRDINPGSEYRSNGMVIRCVKE